MKGRKRHIIFWKLVRPIIALWMRFKFNFNSEIVDLKNPSLILANHNTNWDPILVGSRFKKQIYFVASEHVFRFGFFSKVITYLLDPITRLKATTAWDTALTVLRRIRKGCSVCIFAEGNRSFNGVTCSILSSTGKLAKLSGGDLVTYRMEGGYFTSPRWSGNAIRRGKMTGSVVNVYSAAQLKEMSVEEINEVICRDLYENAFETQEKQMIPYKGRNLAHGLERVLCVCPSCLACGTLKSEKNLVKCSCGFTAEYTEYGFFEGENLPFKTVLEWDEWQTQELIRLVENAEDKPVFDDSDIELNEISADHQEIYIGKNILRFFKDYLEFGDIKFPLEKISGIALHGPQSLDLAFDGKNYELKCADMYCARKYLTVIEYLKNNKISV